MTSLAEYRLTVLPVDLRPVATWAHKCTSVIIKQGKEVIPMVFGVKTNEARPTAFEVVFYFRVAMPEDDQQSHLAEMMEEALRLSQEDYGGADTIVYVGEGWRLNSLTEALEARPKDHPNRDECLTIFIHTKDKGNYHIEADILRHPTRVELMKIYLQEKLTSQ